MEPVGISATEVENVTKLVRELRSLGLRSFEGLGIRFEATGEPGKKTVHVEGLGEVDPDLFGSAV